MEEKGCAESRVDEFDASQRGKMNRKQAASLGSSSEAVMLQVLGCPWI